MRARVSASDVHVAESLETTRNRVSRVTRKHWRGFREPYIRNRTRNRVTGEMAMGETGKGRMRSAMPTVAAFVDELRAVFGADQVDPSIRAGMRGEPNRFWAREGAHELGTPFDGGRREP